MNPKEVESLLRNERFIRDIHPTIECANGPMYSDWAWVFYSFPTKTGLRFSKPIFMLHMCKTKTQKELADRIRKEWLDALGHSGGPWPDTEADLKFIAEHYPDGVPWKTFDEAMAEAQESLK